MNSVLESLISKDYTIVGNENSRWAKTEEHDSLVIDREKQIFYWNSKNIVGDAVTYLIRVKGHTFSEARRILSEYKDFTDTYVYTIKGEGELQDVIAYPKLIDIFWEEGLKNRQYWYNRLLNDDTINRFRLGYHDGWYTIPFFMDGTFRNFQCRKDQPIRS